MTIGKTEEKVEMANGETEGKVEMTNGKAEGKMSLVEAKRRFLEICGQLATEGERRELHAWLAELAPPPSSSRPDLPSLPEEGEAGYSNAEAFRHLTRISEHLRTRLPPEAVLPSEVIRHPTSGEDAGLSEANCAHVDSFLYDEQGEERLVEEGQLHRSYCLDCGSKNIEDLTYITHSCSKERLELIFRELLPPLEGKTVVDVGSRLGAVLYGAYYYSQASRIVGVEINAEFCALQEEAVKTFGLGDRVEVVLGNMCAQGKLLAEAHVVVLNNVFAWFMPEQLQAKMWQCLHRVLAPGTLVVTIPALEESLANLKTGINIASWVSTEACYRPVGEQGQVELSEIKLYKVLPKS